MSGPPRLHQAEWCSDSTGVRGRATDHLVEYHLTNVPRERETRDRLHTATGQRTIPALVSGGTVIATAPARIVDDLATRCLATTVLIIGRLID